jgi:hypothetical protein
MQDETHNPRGEDVVLHVCVPCCPSLFEDIQVDIVGGDFGVVVAIGLWWEGRRGEEG